VGLESARHHTAHAESLEDGAARGGADLARPFRVVEQLANGAGDGVLAVLHEQAVFAVADDLGDAADIAGDHRHSRRHGEQGATAETFAIGDIHQDGRLADFLFQVGHYPQTHSGQQGGILLQGQYLFALRDLEDGHAIVDHADFFFGNAATDQHFADELGDRQVAAPSAV